MLPDAVLLNANCDLLRLRDCCDERVERFRLSAQCAACLLASDIVAAAYASHIKFGIRAFGFSPSLERHIGLIRVVPRIRLHLCHETHIDALPNAPLAQFVNQAPDFLIGCGIRACLNCRQDRPCFCGAHAGTTIRHVWVDIGNAPIALFGVSRIEESTNRFDVYAFIVADDLDDFRRVFIVDHVEFGASTAGIHLFGQVGVQLFRERRPHLALNDLLRSQNRKETVLNAGAGKVETVAKSILCGADAAEDVAIGVDQRIPDVAVWDMQTAAGALSGRRISLLLHQPFGLRHPSLWMNALGIVAARHGVEDIGAGLEAHPFRPVADRLEEIRDATERGADIAGHLERIALGLVCLAERLGNGFLDLLFARQIRIPCLDIETLHPFGLGLF